MLSLKHLAAIAALVALMVVALSACGRDNPAAAPPTALPTATSFAAPPTSTVDRTVWGRLPGPVADLLNKADQAMAGLKSYHAEITTSGMVTQRGSTDFQAPDSVRTVSDHGGESIRIGGETYMRPAGSNQYIDFSATAEPGSVVTYRIIDLSSRQPWQLSDSARVARDGQVIGDEEVNGRATTHIRFTYSLDEALSMASQQNGTPLPTPGTRPHLGMGTVDRWIDKATGYLVQEKMAFGSGPGEPTPPAASYLEMTIVYSRFNEPVVPPIEKPTNVTRSPDIPLMVPTATALPPT